MNISYYIAKKIVFNKKPTFSRFIIRLAIAATAVSVAAMIVTLGMVNGFQHAVSEKVFGFWGHVRVQNIAPIRNVTAEESPLERNPAIDVLLKENSNIVHYQTYATKSVVLKTNDNFEGAILKGIDSSFNDEQQKQFLIEGNPIQYPDSAYSNQILVSKAIADNLHLKVGDNIHCFFIRDEEDVRMRPVVVSGIYKTGIDEYDNNFIIGDIRFLRRLNFWQPNEIGAYEAWLKNPASMDSVAENLYKALPQGIAANSIQQIIPGIFDWLAVQDKTKSIVVIIMVIVAAINLITCLLILVMERTQMIGVLKALGLPTTNIKKIFWYYSAYISLLGIGLGLVFGLGLCFLQQYTGLVKMDEATYYLSEAPIYIIWWQVAAVVLGSIAICFLALRLPLIYINKVSPVKAIRFK